LNFEAKADMHLLRCNFGKPCTIHPQIRFH